MTLVVLEGIDGAGKSTLLQGLQAAFPDAHVTREPTDAPTGKLLRQALQDHTMDPAAELHLFMADHVDHVARLRPLIQDPGQLILADRWSLSCLAYQGVSLHRAGLFPSVAEAVAHIRAALAPFEPPIDLCLLLDLDPTEGVRRKEGGSEKFEETGTLAAVRDAYDLAVEGVHTVRLDAKLPPADVLEHAKKAIQDVVV